MPDLKYDTQVESDIDVPPGNNHDALAIIQLDLADKKDKRKHAHEIEISKAGRRIIVALLIVMAGFAGVDRYVFNETGNLSAFMDLAKSLVMLIAGYLFAKHQ